MRMSLRLLLMVLAVSCAALAATQYVQVRQPLANVYEFLDPQSRIIKQAKRGDHFELVYPGTSWYQVKVADGQVGWLERRAGEVVNSTSSFPVMTVLLIAVLFVGTIVVVFSFIQRQKTAEI